MEFKKTTKYNSEALCIYVKAFNNNEYIGQIFYFYLFDTFFIGNLNILKNKRNQGYGSILLKYCLDDIKNNYKINLVKLTDISSNSRKSNNIYLKFGFKYENNDTQINNDMFIYLN